MGLRLGAVNFGGVQMGFAFGTVVLAHAQGRLLMRGAGPQVSRPRRQMSLGGIAVSPCGSLSRLLGTNAGGLGVVCGHP